MIYIALVVAATGFTYASSPANHIIPSTSSTPHAPAASSSVATSSTAAAPKPNAPAVISTAKPSTPSQLLPVLQKAIPHPSINQLYPTTATGRVDKIFSRVREPILAHPPEQQVERAEAVAKQAEQAKRVEASQNRLSGLLQQHNELANSNLHNSFTYRDAFRSLQNSATNIEKAQASLTAPTLGKYTVGNARHAAGVSQNTLDEARKNLGSAPALRDHASSVYRSRMGVTGTPVSTEPPANAHRLPELIRNHGPPYTGQEQTQASQHINDMYGQEPQPDTDQAHKALALKATGNAPEFQALRDGTLHKQLADQNPNQWREIGPKTLINVPVQNRPI